MIGNVCMKIACVMIAAASLSFCKTGERTETEQPRPVKGQAAVYRDVGGEVSGFGSLTFLTKVDIASPREGTVKKLFFREGDSARRGAAAVLIENPQMELALRRAEDSYAQAAAAVNVSRSRLLEGRFAAEAEVLEIEKAEREREQARRSYEEEKRKLDAKESLYTAGGITGEEIRAGRFELESLALSIDLMERELDIRRIGSRDKDLAAAGFPPEAGTADMRLDNLIALKTTGLRAELESAGAQLLAAERELESARVALDELTITVPVSSVVGARYFEEGERVKQDDKILTLIDTASLYAIVPVRETDALRLEKGMDAEVDVDGAGVTTHARVDLVYPQADSQSLSFMVRLLLDDDAVNSAKLKPGMFARVKIRTGDERKALVVNESSIVETGGQPLVFVISGGALSERKVEPGESIGAEREIISGLKEGEVVALRPRADFREGTRVLPE